MVSCVVIGPRFSDLVLLQCCWKTKSAADFPSHTRTPTLDYLIKAATPDTMFNFLKSAILALLVVATPSLAADVSNAYRNQAYALCCTDGRAVLLLLRAGFLCLLIHVAGGSKCARARVAVISLAGKSCAQPMCYRCCRADGHIPVGNEAKKCKSKKTGVVCLCPFLLAIDTVGENLLCVGGVCCKGGSVSRKDMYLRIPLCVAQAKTTDSISRVCGSQEGGRGKVPRMERLRERVNQRRWWTDHRIERESWLVLRVDTERFRAGAQGCVCAERFPSEGL